MKSMNAVPLAALLSLAGAGALSAQQPAAKPKPKVPEAQARATALARVPHGTVKSEELEHEGGRWIYSYDVAVPGRKGIEEVNVDAMTGKVVAVEHEGPAKEKAEARQEAGKKRGH